MHACMHMCVSWKASKFPNEYICMTRALHKAAYLQSSSTSPSQPLPWEIKSRIGNKFNNIPFFPLAFSECTETCPTVAFDLWPAIQVILFVVVTRQQFKCFSYFLRFLTNTTLEINFDLGCCEEKDHCSHHQGFMQLLEKPLWKHRVYYWTNRSWQCNC